MSSEGAFAAAPKVVKPKKKYREPIEQEEEEQQTKFTYNNLMWNRRVERGNTYAAIVTSKNVEIPHKNTFKPRQTAAKPQQTNEPYNQANGTRRANIEIFTDQFVETLTNKPPRYQKDTQTEFVIEKPIVRLYMPNKTGKDWQTQIWDNELFDFDYEVEPLLRVICGKTLQISRMEVLQEEELRVMRERQKQLLRLEKDIALYGRESREVSGLQEKQRMADNVLQETLLMENQQQI